MVIEAHGEAVEEIPETPATCTENGKTVKLSCSECGKVVQQQKTIKKGHLLTELHFDESGHWYECDCGYTEGNTFHSFGEWSTEPVNNGEKDVLVRRCPCGYEEYKDAPATDADNPKKGIGTVGIILICVGSAVVLAAAVTAVIVVKKRKAQN